MLARSGEMREVCAPKHQFLFWQNFGLWLSLVERLVRDQEAVGSNPTSPISNNSPPLSHIETKNWVEPAGWM